MSDILAVTEDRITRKVSGEDRIFIFLDAYDRAELLRADLKARQDAHEQDKARLVANLKAAEIDKLESFAQIQEFDKNYPRTADEMNWIKFCSDPANEISILAVSLKKTYGDQAEAIAKKVTWHIDSRMPDKAKICGLNWGEKAQGENPDPNSAKPGTYWTPAQENSTGLKPNAA